MELTEKPSSDLTIPEPARHPVSIGTGMHTWTANHCYAYVYDEEGVMLFSINTTKPTDELVCQCLESYFDGHRHGRTAGAAAKINEIKRALEILPGNPTH